MERSGASAYVYAKASGILGKSFIGSRMEKLFSAQSLSSLWELIFDDPVPAVPEVLLANQIETKASSKFLEDYINLLEVYSKPDNFLLGMLDRVEVENLKVFAASASLNEPKVPRFANLGKYAKLNYSAYPDIKKITENSCFSWYDHVPSLDEVQSLSYKLDLIEINELWNSLNHINDSSRNAIVEFYRNEFSVKNMIWALRLKVYYNFSENEIIDNLFYVEKSHSAQDPICGCAFDVLNRGIDSFDDWRDWKFSKYLNPNMDGSVWKIDPMWVEQRFRSVECKDAMRIFHQYPMTAATLVMYFRLKIQELGCIRAATEALRLGADSREAMFAAGILAEV